ncbi:MAG: type II secretion system minor pseudopilin GspJ [Gammaproteobacteria bacterium]|nr:type II secretion system minor pseudopilin GspJ [Gammaproteobacteria bacterium]NNJ97794.1 type II secretion system minor pseudopilin GspJ [Gammaproteobacteria bacterium]
MTLSIKQAIHGFTLLELLVAVTIFSVLSAMAYGGLRNVIDNSQQTDLSMQRLQEVQLAVLKISRDFSQLAQRRIRDEYGNNQDYLVSGDGGDIFIEFSRNGRRNPAELQRSHLQRVAYKLEENQLYRLDWPHLDRPQEMQPYESVLLSDVESVSIRFLDRNNEWHDQWPPLNTNLQASDMSESLSAIEFTLELTDWGEIMRIYRISS